MTLGREPQAKATYHVLNPELKFFGEFFDSNLGADAKKQDYQSSVSIPGPVITVTFTNLKNSYYVDNAGHKKFITKIERTFSDLQKAPSFPENSAILSINEDPTDGFWFDFSNGVTVSDTFYDENNQPISIDGNGWLAVTSLNAMYGGIRENQTLSGSPFHVEQVTPIHGGQSYALAGSSISVHSDGSLYADKTNFSAINYDGSTNDSITKKGVSAWPDNKQGWDGKGPDEYFGAGLIKINGSQITLNFKLAHTEDPVWNPYVWATMSTIIPATSFNLKRPTPPTAPSKPELQTTTVNYNFTTTIR